MQKIIVVMEGGIIQDIQHIPAGIAIEVRDFDVEGSDEELSKTDEGEEYVESIFRGDAAEQVGIVGVDAGLMLVGDPCYFDQSAGGVGEWGEFCNQLVGKDTLQLNYKLGHPGRGVVIGNFGGDGVFPVFVEKDKQGQVSRLIVDFS